jgi:hypothetical protein
MPNSSSRRHAVLAIRIIKKSVHRLLILPKAARKFKARHIGKLSTGGTLVPERRSLGRIPGFDYSRVVLEELVW